MLLTTTKYKQNKSVRNRSMRKNGGGQWEMVKEVLFDLPSSLQQSAEI